MMPFKRTIIFFLIVFLECSSSDNGWLIFTNSAFNEYKYWSKLESLLNITDADYYDLEPFTETSGSVSSEVVESGKLSNCIARYYNTYTSIADEPYCLGNEGSRIIYPFGNSLNPDIVFSNGTISFWINLNVTGTNSQSEVIILGASRSDPLSFIVSNNGSERKLFVYSNNAIMAESGSVLSDNTWHHIYIVWKSSITLGTNRNKSILMYIDSNLVIESDYDIPDISSVIFTITNYGKNGAYYSTSGWPWEWGCRLYGTALLKIDNIRIWNTVFSEDPSSEYNSGEGNEFSY